MRPLPPPGDPVPNGLKGPNAFNLAALAGAGLSGAGLGPRSSNPVGQMSPYGGQVAASGGSQQASTVGGQNCAPFSLPSDSFLRGVGEARSARGGKKKVPLGTRLTDSPCCDSGLGGTGVSSGRPAQNGMSACNLNPAICAQPNTPAPPYRVCCWCVSHTWTCS